VNLRQRVFRLRADDFEAITHKLGLVDWHCDFSRKGVDLYVVLFDDVI
jgi:hypothetical protein